MKILAKFSFLDYSMTKEGLSHLIHVVMAMAVERV